MSDNYTWQICIFDSSLPQPPNVQYGAENPHLGSFEFRSFHFLMDSSLIATELLIGKINAYYISSIAKSETDLDL